MQLLKKQIFQEIFLIPHTICDFDSLMIFKKSSFFSIKTTPNFSNERLFLLGKKLSGKEPIREDKKKVTKAGRGGVRMPKEPGDIFRHFLGFPDPGEANHMGNQSFQVC